MESDSELFFRIAFGILWLLYFFIRMYYQKKVAKNLKYTHLNEKSEKKYFALFALSFLLLPLYFLTPWVDFASIALSRPVRWAGAFLTLGGLLLFASSHKALGDNWTAILALSDKHKLVLTGPYKYIRHPMYSAFYLIGFGFTILSSNWLIGVVYLIPLTIMYAARVGREEVMLKDRFGAEYSDYIKKTGRLIPRF